MNIIICPVDVICIYMKPSISNMNDNNMFKSSKKDREGNVNDKNKNDKVDTTTHKDTENGVSSRSSNKYNTRNSKKGNNKVGNKNALPVKSKPNNKKVSHDDGDDSSSDDNESSEYENNEEEDEDDFIVNDKGTNSLDNSEYKKFLNSMFPSAYMKKKTKDAESKKEREGNKNKNKNKNKNSTKSIPTKRNKRKSTSKEEEESEEEEEDSEYVTEESNEEEESDNDDESDEDDDTEEEYYVKSAKKGKNGINLILSISDPNEYETDYSEEDEYSTNSSAGSSDEDDTSDDEDDDSDDSDKEVRKNKRLKKEEELRTDSLLAQKELHTINALKMSYTTILETDKENEIALEGLKNLEKKESMIKKNMHKKEKKQKTTNTRKYKSIINKKNLMNDYKYFKNKLSLEDQRKVIEEVNVINKIDIVQKPYRISLLESSIPPYLKAIAMSKISLLRNMEPGNGEFFKVKTWVDTFMKIPFDIYRSLPLTMSDGVDKCHEYMENSKNVLDNAVYGLNDAKMQIMQLIGQWISNPNAMGTSIAIKGPMGTGKTTLVKEGISKILNRDFAFLAWATDSSVLEGHGYTYEGSTWGKIVDILIHTKSMNPVIYFDELDKISDTPKGEEIAGILTHLTDTSQNSLFHDKYFSEIEFDLSKCLFIFSYNDEKKVNPILLDRMYKIQTKGYDKKEKTVIASKYIIPKIIEQVNFKEEDIIIPNETIHFIIDSYTGKEDGVRNLKRCLEIVYTKLNMFRLMKPDSTLFDGEVAFKVEFPFTVTTEVLGKMIKRTDLMSQSLHMMYL